MTLDLSNVMNVTTSSTTGKDVVNRSTVQTAFNDIATAVNDLSGTVAFSSSDTSFQTRTAFAAANITDAGTTITAVNTNGYSAAGDGGGALYKYVASEPSHPGKVQSADGAWWELASPVIYPTMLGVDLTDTASDQSTGLNNFFEVLGSLLTPGLIWGDARGQNIEIKTGTRCTSLGFRLHVPDTATTSHTPASVTGATFGFYQQCVVD